MTAQSVLDAYYTEADRLDREVSHEEMLAAARRAVADVVAPEVNFYGGSCCERELKSVRSELFHIANELKDLPK